MSGERRTIRLIITGLGLAVLLLAAAVTALLSGEAQAAAPIPGAALPPANNSQPQIPHSALRIPHSQAPLVGVWTDIAPFPTASTPPTPVASSIRLKRAGAAAYPPNGKFYVLGGRHATDGEDLTLRYIWEYTPGNPGTWAIKNALIDTDAFTTRYTANMAVAVLTDTVGQRIYAIGGSTLDSNITSQVRAYNPIADTITTIVTDPWPASPLRIPGGYTVYNNKMYIFGGFSALANGGTGGVFTDTWQFDPLAPAGSRWTQLPTANLSLGRAYIAGATLDGKIYAIGGDTWNPATRQLVPQSIVERLDLLQINPSWGPVASLPNPRGDMSAWAYDTGTGYEISGGVVIAGGVFPVPDAKGYRYDPNTDSWSDWVSLLHPTRNYGAAQLNGVLYAFGGYDYTNNIPDGANFSQRYDATGAIATPTDTPLTSPTVTNTPFSTNYNVCAFNGISIVPGTSLVPNSACDDCIVTVTLPFPYTLYDQTFTQAQLSSNGTLGFIFPEGNPVNICLPSVTAISAVFGYWDDLLTNGGGQGIYTSISGSAPNRIYNVEWRASRTAASGGGAVNFEIRLYENAPQFDIVYGAVAGNGNTATVGVQRDRGSLYTQYTCNNLNLIAGTQLLFTLAGGVCPTHTPTFTPTVTSTPTQTVTGTPPTATMTPTVTNTPCGNTDYVISQSTGAVIDPGVDSIGNNCDDCVTAVNLPFAYSLYSATYNSVNVSSNGNLQFVSNATVFSNVCLPTNALDTAILAYWDDLRTDTGAGCTAYTSGCGIFTSTSGSAPNRVFNIEWRAVLFNPATVAINFEVRLYEGQSRFDVVYDIVNDPGTSATVGVQKDVGSRFTEYECNTGGLTQGLQLTFTLPPCGTSTPTSTGTPPTATDTRTPTNTLTPSPQPPAPTNTPTALPTTTCGPGADYVITQSTGAAIDDGATDIGNHDDDSVTNIALPFPVQLYGVTYNNANVSSNGNVQFSSSNNIFNNTCLPNATINNVIMALWDDLDTRGTGNGIFISTVGSAPNRIFNVEWRVFYINTTTFLNFELRLYENQDRFEFIYGVIPDGGLGATVGVQRGAGASFTQFSCNTAVITEGLQLVFTSPPCDTATPTNTGTPPTNTPTNAPTFTPTATPTVCGAANYQITTSTGAAITGGAVDIGNHGDDLNTNIALPFTAQLYGVGYSTVNVGSNGNLQFVSNSTAFTNACLPTNVVDSAILANWDDLRTDNTGAGCASYGSGCGIFTSTSGSAPNRIFNIEWRTVYYNAVGTLANFEVRLYENEDRFDVVYAITDGGGSTTVGVQKDTGSLSAQFECDTANSLTSGLQLTFRLLGCDDPTPTATSTPTNTDTPTPLPVLAGHVTWQGLPAQPHALQQQAVTLTLKSAAIEVNYAPQTTNANGYFTTTLSGLPNGTYAWRVKGTKWLANFGLVGLTGAPVTNVEMGLLRVGDSDNNNVINIADFNILRSTFGRSIGDPGYDDRADLDGNQAVTIVDFNLLKLNFGTSGAPPVTP